MPIPNINLIPPAYYLRKKVKAATIIASVVLLAEIAGLVAFAVMQSQKNEQLKTDRDTWQTQANLVSAAENKASQIRSSVSDVKTKIDFINEVFTDNAQWPTVFNNIRNYTYPRVQYASMTPAPGTNNITLRVRVPDTRTMDAQVAMTLYWSNLLRSPIVQAASVNTFLGYETAEGGTAAGGLPMPGGMPSSGAPMPGGPPMPGGAPMPGAPMPGGPPAGRWIGSPTQIASPALAAIGGQQIDLTQGMGSGLGPIGPEALQQYGIVVPQPPPLRDFDFSVQLTKTFDVPQFKGGAAAAPQDQFAQPL
jgi:hypothetical protein